MEARLILGLVVCSCATSAPPAMGVISGLTHAAIGSPLCEHRVPEAACVRHHPDLVAQFQAVNDWCPEHDLPESQCYTCHPDLSFEPIPAAPAGADLVIASKEGEAVGALEALAAPGKVTLFDFYADWCVPCRKIDVHVLGLLQKRGDLALRKLNVVSWDSPLAREHLGGVGTLPYVVVAGRDGKVRRAITGLDLSALDAAIEEASK